MSVNLRHAVLGALILLVACGQGAPTSTFGNATKDEVASAPAPAMSVARGMESRELAADQAVSGESPLPDVPHDPATTGPMLIRTGQASVEIDSLEPAITAVRRLAQQFGGYISNSQTQLGAEQIRTATLELKVPSERFDALVNGLSPLGRVEFVNVSAQDVGEEFTDVTARVANARRLEQRLIELLATRTGKLSDVLEIERELARVREEIERMEGRLRYLKAHASMSTLSITVHEKAPLVGEVGSGGVIGEAFRQAWRNFVNFIAGAIASSGVFVPLGALLLGALWLLRRLWKGRRGL
ncbi:MAG: DUF4349 domain-containing protein [Gemmatimonadales bacterium]